MTRVQLGRLSPEHQAFVERASEKSEHYKRPQTKKAKPTRYGEEFDSELELDFADELEMWRIAVERRGRSRSKWRYHSTRFRLAKNLTYTPDFQWLPHTKRARATFYEVKGSWKQKGARDSRTRLQIAAYMYQEFNWYGVTREKGIWVFETIHAADAAEGGCDGKV